MTTTLVHVHVDDFERWKRGFDEIASLRKQFGALSERILRDTSSAGDVFIMIEWTSPEAARKWMTSDELREAQKRSGGSITKAYTLAETERTLA